MEGKPKSLCTITTLDPKGMGLHSIVLETLANHAKAVNLANRSLRLIHCCHMCGDLRTALHGSDAKYAFPLFCKPDKRFFGEGYRPVQSMVWQLSSGDTVADHMCH